MTAGRILNLLYQIAPAYAANMAPPLVKYWRGWNCPINARWLGEHKTVIGFGAGVVAAVVAAGIQSRLPGRLGAGLIEQPLAHGLRLGVGAMLGDTIKSFLKRRAGRKAGAALGAVRSDRLRARSTRVHPPADPSLGLRSLTIVALSMAERVRWSTTWPTTSGSGTRAGNKRRRRTCSFGSRAQRVADPASRRYRFFLLRVGRTGALAE